MNVELRELRVQDLMQSNPTRLDEDTPLEDIFTLFTNQRVSCVPVVDSENRLQGTITITDLERSRQLFDLKEYIGIIVSGLESDLRGRIASTFALDGPIDLRAREVMSVKTPRVMPTDTLQTLSKQLLDHNSHIAIVIDEQGQVIGTVSTFDILKRI